MNTPPDWQQAQRDLLEEGRKRVGPPPDVDKVEALLRGELPQEEAEHVRGVLAYYPELVRVMTANDSGNDQSVLTESERETDFARIRQRLGLTPPTPLRREHPPAFAWAAGVFIALAIAGIVIVRLRAPERRPLLTKIMIADEERGVRGGPAAPPTVLAPVTDYLLKPLFRPVSAYQSYRFELVDLRSTPPRSLWTRDGVEHHPDGSFPVRLSTRDLEPGRYQLILYGVDGKDERLATYAFRIDPPR